MKMGLIALLGLTFNLHAHENKSLGPNSTKVKYANIYADQLIIEFDKLLDNSDHNFLESETYAKILAARDFIENQGVVKSFGSNRLIEVTDAEIYVEVTQIINANAKDIYLKQNQNKNLDLNKNIIYPSISKSGNLTGNTFPKNVWSLTYDDGPRSKRTEQIVDHLYRHGMKASFFMLTREAKKYPVAADYVLDADMELALHSYNHLNLNKVDAKTMDYEVGTALKDLEKIGNRKINLFRLPYGSGMRNTQLRTKIANNKLIHVFWNVDTLDWKDKDPQSIYNRTIKQMNKTPKKSGIILFHDIHKQTVVASELVLKYLSDQKKTVCTVGDVVKYLNNQKQDCLK